MSAAARVFTKTVRRGDEALLVEEARSLAALRATGAVRVPALLGATREALTLEWLDSGSGAGEGVNAARSWRHLGSSLAALHRVRAPRYGWEWDNFIGTVPQPNAWNDSWAAFWREERIGPCVNRARRSRALAERDAQRVDALMSALPELLDGADADGASLLHGDLWRGNVMLLADGASAVVDPSCYFGHREVDLAMADLFGGFDDVFFEAYDAAYPLLRGHVARRPVYQLYYLLVHVIMFGDSYAGRTRAVLEAAGF